MSRLAEFRQLEQKLAAQLAELEAMKSSGELQKEIEFETKLRDLLSKYGYSLRDIINILILRPVAVPQLLRLQRKPHAVPGK